MKKITNPLPLILLCSVMVMIAQEVKLTGSQPARQEALKKFQDDISDEKLAQRFNKKLQKCKPQGARDSIYCGSLSVFENHKTRQGRKIDLNIMIIPAIHPSTDKNAIFYFDGGPGIAATKNKDFFSEISNPYRQNHDIVLVDIRGTGGSNPLHCISLQSKENLQAHFEEMYPVEAVKECLDSLTTRADLSQYTTTNIVKDMEAVRQWLGYEKIITVGFSYGTRLAQEYMRRFPSSLETAVLMSPTSTGSKMPLYHAKFAEATWTKLLSDCTMDSLCKEKFPDLQKDFNSLMISLMQKPERIKVSDTVTVNLSWDAFQTKIRSQMYHPYTLRQLPFIIHQAANGNWKPFIALYPTEASFDDFLAEGLYLSISCAEDVPFIQPKKVKRLTENTFMGDYRIVQQQQACANWVQGEIPEDFLKPVRSTTPVLVLVGEWDPVTPVSMAKEIVRYFPNSQLIIVPQMSHTSWGLSNEECLDEVIIAFIKSKGKAKVNSDCTLAMLPLDYKINEE